MRHQEPSQRPGGNSQIVVRGVALAEEDGAGQLEWSQTVNGKPIYNFAVCRVHYRSEAERRSGRTECSSASSRR